MIRIDMSEYSGEAHSGTPDRCAARLRRYEEGGQLTEAVRRRPYAVLLFDEVEKAHQDVVQRDAANLGRCRLTDGQGRVVNFKNTIVIMTSNLGSHRILRLPWGPMAGEGYERMKTAVLNELRQHFRPEFLTGWTRSLSSTRSRKST